MAVMAADLHKGVLSTWNGSGLNAVFKSYWQTSRTSDYTVLHDQEAGPTQPFPYCVFIADQGNTTDKMTGSANKSQRFEIRDVPFEFKVHTRSLTDGTTAKKVAIALLEEIIKVFGGHPTVEPSDVTLDNGAVLQITYLNDNGSREGDNNYCWHIRYKFSVDVPVAA